MSSTALSQFQQLRSDLASRFPERREVIDGALAAVLAGDHCLLLGPPDPQTLCASLTSRLR
jgi:MoxR-like ATPase